jgi:hypothetical protein
MLSAADLASDHQLGIWDAVILSAAAQAGCRVLLSEDLQHGFTWGGVTIVNPFVEAPHLLLDALLGERSGRIIVASIQAPATLWAGLHLAPAISTFSMPSIKAALCAGNG